MILLIFVSSTGLQPPVVFNLSQVSLFTLFKWLTEAETLVEVDGRLDALQSRYPTIATYIVNLRRLKALWARCYQTWQPAFLLKTSNFAENVFWSIKSFIDYQFQAVDVLPEILVTAMQKRSLSVTYKHAVSARAMRAEVNSLRTAGLGSFCDSVSAFLTAGAAAFLVGQIKEAAHYAVEPLDQNNVLDLVETHVMPRRKSSAARFLLLLGNCLIRYDPL